MLHFETSPFLFLNEELITILCKYSSEKSKTYLKQIKQEFIRKIILKKAKAILLIIIVYKICLYCTMKRMSWI